MPEITEDRVRQIARDEARDEVTRFFNHYLLNIFPQQIDRILHAHNQDATAHGGILRQRWVLLGIISGLSFTGGAGFVKLVGALL